MNDMDKPDLSNGVRLFYFAEDWLWFLGIKKALQFVAVRLYKEYGSYLLSRMIVQYHWP